MKYLKILISICIVVSFVNCRINRTRHKQKVGRWISKDSVGQDFYKYIYHYKKGMEVKTSKFSKIKRYIEQKNSERAFVM
jgi:hypothetical protein